MKEKLIRIIAIVSLTLAVILLATTLDATRKVTYLKQGALKGFEVTGMYREQPNKFASLALQLDTSNRWQFTNTDNTVVNGTIKLTDDPNLIDLVDETGATYGTVHIAYSMPSEDEGLLFLKTASEVTAFDKAAGKPAFLQE
ncbi:hypothetical protein K6V98_03745 [Collinsella sp. AGMB00827]|uniref:Uncharacterized protein n=1 Tax=Collinsella ureilytica TaxID=2869515 RepID=A0ABS7MK58_9ACTN|nr:hypothetical protein [Collinsella urealyticum]MBY4797470.1 hypothetical protein [Collinsella urealyticum]